MPVLENSYAAKNLNKPISQQQSGLLAGVVAAMFAFPSVSEPSNGYLGLVMQAVRGKAQLHHADAIKKLKNKFFPRLLACQRPVHVSRSYGSRGLQGI